MKGIISILALFSNFAIAQNSSLYSSARKLIADRSYSIDKNTFNNINTIEKVLLPLIYNNIKYPAVAKENGEQGVVIVQLLIDNKTKLYTYKIVEADAEVFKQPVMDFFSRLSQYIRDEICPAGESIQVYIPVKFFINQNSFKKALKKNHAVTIETNDIAPEVAIIK
jgi:outer membrane biosynthesis protein TonB